MYTPFTLSYYISKPVLILGISKIILTQAFGVFFASGWDKYAYPLKAEGSYFPIKI